MLRFQLISIDEYDQVSLVQTRGARISTKASAWNWHYKSQGVKADTLTIKCRIGV